MKWLKKWRYMIFWVMAGIVYLSVVDDWQVYAEPLEQVKNWYAGIKQDFRQADTVRAEEGTPWASVSGTDGAAVPGAEEITVSGADATTVSGADGAAFFDGGNAVISNEEDVAMPPEDDPATEGSAASEPDGGEMYHTVEDDYFADAVFIGDSRTVGMLEYGGLEETADFYASTGLTIYKLFDSKIVPVEGQRKKITVEEALSQNTYAKIYLMIGINEMGTGTVESFVAAYQEAVDHLLELQPDAILYIQGIIKVTTERSEQGDYINNEGIEARNEALSQLADNERIFYLDVNPKICDETGGMEASYTFDGVHLKAQYIDIWKTYLKEHAIVRETESEEEQNQGMDVDL
ncbi:MAG: GDSL-type esterase/lipase family protein [Lachnospiraceae bacterium]|nr:GDSL-type esterase/lipase family protein [Butyrivibrio sp.]MCM1343198.1 GDSL-type esterase/lipase family protein [Muribaculaceae bacterium]MCM1409548.1 GDSL-type esterase/lipase family protein [Lachnospiraceae bacterium]